MDDFTKKLPKPDLIDPRLYYTATNAALLCGVNPYTMRRYAAIGAAAGGVNGRHNPLNGKLEFKGEELLRFLFRIPISHKRNNKKS